MGTLKGFVQPPVGDDDSEDTGSSSVPESQKSEVLKGIVEKANAGDPLTPKEQRVYDAWKAGQRDDVPRPENPAPSSGWGARVGSGTGWGPRS